MEVTRASLFRNGGGVAIAGTPGAQLVQGLELKGKDKLIKKTRFSPFHMTPLDGVLRRCGHLPPLCNTPPRAHRTPYA